MTSIANYFKTVLRFQTRSQKINVVHLDDHKLFCWGLRKCLEDRINTLNIISFNDSFEALNFIAESLKKKDRIDLIITDFNHGGLNGYDFGKTIRILEKVYDKRIPILLLSMIAELPQISKGYFEKVFDKGLSKNSSGEQIIEAIYSLAQKPRNTRELIQAAAVSK